MNKTHSIFCECYASGRRSGIRKGIVIGAATMFFGMMLRKFVDEMEAETYSYMNAKN